MPQSKRLGDWADRVDAGPGPGDDQGAITEQSAGCAAGGCRGCAGGCRCNIERAHRKREALQLRREGLTLREIARRLKVALPTVHDWIKTEMAAIPREDAKQLLQLYVDRFEAVTQWNMERMRAGDTAASGNVIRATIELAKLAGFYQDGATVRLTADETGRRGYTVSFKMPGRDGEEVSLPSLQPPIEHRAPPAEPPVYTVSQTHRAEPPPIEPRAPRPHDPWLANLVDQTGRPLRE